MHLSYSSWCSQDVSTGATVMTERGEGVGGRFFWKFVYENDISCTLNGIIRGLVMWSDIYQSPTPPFFWNIILLQSRGAGAWPFVPLAMPVTVVQPGFVRGAKAREQSDRAGGGCGRGFPLPTGKEIFKNLCLKTAFSCTLDPLLGVVYVVA